MTLQISKRTISGDTLLLEAFDDAEQLAAGQHPTIYKAQGWVSATTNYYDPTAYTKDAAGNLTLVKGAVSRAMTNAEALSYCLQLVKDQNGLPGATGSSSPPPPAPLAFPLTAPPAVK